MSAAWRSAAIWLLKLPIRLYRVAVSPFLPASCRHLPTCSQYADEALSMNGPWKGLWLALSRLLRCHPWGSEGYDPVPDLRQIRHPWWAPWRYGRWTGQHLCHKLDPEAGCEDENCREKGCEEEDCDYTNVSSPNAKT